MKTLQDIAAQVKGASIDGRPDLAIKDIEHDSRKVQAGTLFVCIPGVHTDGHMFIPQAVRAGAVEEAGGYRGDGHPAAGHCSCADGAGARCSARRHGAVFP